MDSFGGFNIPEHIPLLTPKEQENLERSWEKIKAGETTILEQFPDHEDEARQAFLFGVTQARRTAIALAAGEEDPIGAALLPENQISVSGLRSALRDAVNDGTITEEQAETLTWNQATEMLGAKGYEVVGLDAATLDSKVYIHEAPRYAPLTKGDLAQDIDQIRLIKDRRREALQEGTLAALRAHLDGIWQEVRVAAEEFHQGTHPTALTNRPDFLRIAEELSKMPEHFRKQAFCLSIFGVKKFARMPTSTSSESEAAFVPRILEIPIPMFVPAAEPAGSSTILTWLDPADERWRFQAPASEDELGHPKSLLDHDLASLREIADAGDSATALLLSFIERNNPQQVVAAVEQSPIIRGYLDKTISKLKKRDPWFEIIREARKTFGWEHTADALIKLMGLNRDPKTDDLRSSWKFLPESPPNISRFKTIFRQDRNQQSDTAIQSTEAVQEFMNMIS